MDVFDEFGIPNGDLRNKHKVLQGLIAINAWFMPSELDPKRLSLKANVSFKHGKMGFENQSEVIFQLSVTRCEIVFVPPGGLGCFGVDPSTVKMTKPLQNFVTRHRRTKSKRRGWRSVLSVGRKGLDVDLSADGGSTVDDTTEIISEQSVDPFNVLHTRSHEQFYAWEVESKLLKDERLRGSLWDAHRDSLLDLIDNRSETDRARSTELNLPPTARLEVRCRSEDILIEHIEYKDPERQKMFELVSHKEHKLKAAEAYLRYALLREGLKVGDLSNPYSEVTICDATIAISDRNT